MHPSGRVLFQSAVPNEVLSKIFNYLEPKDLLKVSKVCSLWRQLVKADFFQVGLKLLEAHPIPSPNTGLSGGNTRVTRCLLHDNTFFVGSEDGSIKSWSRIDGRCNGSFQGFEAMSFQGFKTMISNLAVEGEYLIATAHTKEPIAKIWNINTGDMKHTLEGHRKNIFCLSTREGFLFTGSWDSTAKMWDIETGSCVTTFSGHSTLIRCLSTQGERLFTGSEDRTVKMWAIPDGRCLRTFQGHERMITCLALRNESLYTGSDDQTVRQWIIETGACIWTSEKEDSGITCLDVSMREALLVTGSLHGKVSKWSLNTKERLHNFIQGSTEEVEKLKVETKVLLIGIKETVKVFDVIKGTLLFEFHLQKGVTHK